MHVQFMPDVGRVSRSAYVRIAVALEVLTAIGTIPVG
jgi:hypothetical protein